MSWTKTAAGWSKNSPSLEHPAPPQKSTLPLRAPMQRDPTNSIDPHHNRPRQYHRPSLIERRHQNSSYLFPYTTTPFRSVALPLTPLSHKIWSTSNSAISTPLGKTCTSMKLDYRVRELLFEKGLPAGGNVEIAVTWKKSDQKGTTSEPTVLRQDGMGIGEDAG